MKKLGLSAATGAAGAVTVATAQRVVHPAVTDSQKVVSCCSLLVCLCVSPLTPPSSQLVSMFPVTVADYISRAESQSRQNLPQKENHAGPEPKVQAHSSVSHRYFPRVGCPARLMETRASLAVHFNICF